MNGIEPFPTDTMVLKDGRFILQDSLLDHVTLVGFVDCTNPQEQGTLINPLYDQFKETAKARFVLLDSCAGTAPIDFSAGKKGVYSLACTDNTGMCSALLTQWPAGKTYALVDRKGIIRSYYKASTSEEKKVLVEHMSLLLPRERQEKVELKRGEQK